MFRDSSAFFFADAAKKWFACGEQPFSGFWRDGLRAVRF